VDRPPPPAISGTINSNKAGSEMSPLLPPSLRVDRTAFSVTSQFDDADEKAYWLVRTPAERLRHMETLRRINYGRRATARLQRILEIAER
ncbi:MAG: hypothetical protein MN733_21355, partial [Nitrososphaera sp.]|nr:hypothetical protein [Nitrososphaera sp.]